MVDTRQSEQIRETVRQRYGEVARRKGASCCGDAPAASNSPCCGGAPDESASSCCDGQPAESSACCCGGEGTVSLPDLLDKAEKLGYTLDDLLASPLGAAMSLGCGNPGAVASLRPGEVVLDLGSGGGFDCFLASRQVGESGRVIGVDMTPEMLQQARATAAQSGLANVEFRLGEIEHLPVADNTVDVILSNCVVNLSPDKEAVFREAYRVLKPGGRLAISDTVATAPLSEKTRQDLALWSCCLGGATLVDDLERFLEEAGFESIAIRPQDDSRQMIGEWAPGRGIEEYVLSATIEAVKPKA